MSVTEGLDAYEKWLVEARENGHNTEPEVFAAGFEAGYHAANLDYDQGYADGQDECEVHYCE
jgi:hypothetical protein